MANVSVSHGDRAIHSGLGRNGKQCAVLGVRRAFAVVRFDDGAGMLVLAKDLQPVQRRPLPMF